MNQWQICKSKDLEAKPRIPRQNQRSQIQPGVIRTGFFGPCWSACHSTRITLSSLFLSGLKWLNLKLALRTASFFKSLRLRIGVDMPQYVQMELLYMMPHDVKRISAKTWLLGLHWSFYVIFFGNRFQNHMATWLEDICKEPDRAVDEPRWPALHSEARRVLGSLASCGLGAEWMHPLKGILDRIFR